MIEDGQLYCEVCEGEIGLDDSTCPHCGANVPTMGSLVIRLFVGGIVLPGLLVGVGLVLGLLFHALAALLFLTVFAVIVPRMWDRVAEVRAVKKAQAGE